jgi:putative chitinase
MTWPIALRALYDGMIKGMFTGKRLADYFNASTDDPIGARRIVNGTDKAKLIAGYHNSFLGAITAAHDPVQPADVSPEQAAPDDKPPEKSGTFWTVISTMFGGALTSLLAVDNVWGFAVAAMLLVGGGVALWAFGTGRLQILRSKAL